MAAEFADTVQRQAEDSYQETNGHESQPVCVDKLHDDEKARVSFLCQHCGSQIRGRIAKSKLENRLARLATTCKTCGKVTEIRSPEL